MTEENGIPVRKRYSSRYDRFEGRFGPHRCGLCGAPLPPRRQKWCSKQCVDFIARLGYDWNVTRGTVIKRDKWTCRHCGRRDKKLTPKVVRTDVDYIWEGKPVYKTIGLPWVVDHIVPIALGGAEFDLTNLQLLCPDCNAEKTAQDHVEIAARRQEVKAQLALRGVVPLEKWS